MNTVAIVGAGASGVLVAIQLLNNVDQHGILEVCLVDPSSGTGKGVAYSTANPDHLLNVSAANMSAFPDRPDHFVQWLSDRGLDCTPLRFVPRVIYGQYLEDCLIQAERCSNAVVTRVFEEVVDIRRDGFGYLLNFLSGASLASSAVVLALGSPQLSTDWVPPGLVGSEDFISDPWESDLNRRCCEDKRVLIVGTGLTMVDVALSIGYGKQLVAVSRRGLLPRAHRVVASAPVEPPKIPAGFLEFETLRSAIKSHIDVIERRVGDWRPAVDSLRLLTNRLWSRLSIEDQRRFLAEDMRIWDSLRHRMAPESAEAIERMCSEGSLEVCTGLVESARQAGGGVEISFSDGSTDVFDRVINCTGPSRLSAFAGGSGRLLRNLADSGLVVRHSLDQGLDVDHEGRLFQSAGIASSQFVAVGPLRRGSLWETTAIPEIRQQAQEVSCIVLDALSADPRSRVAPFV